MIDHTPPVNLDLLRQHTAVQLGFCSRVLQAKDNYDIMKLREIQITVRVLSEECLLNIQERALKIMGFEISTIPVSIFPRFSLLANQF